MDLISISTSSMGFSPLRMFTLPTFSLQYQRKGLVCSLQVLNLFLMVSMLSSARPLVLALASRRSSNTSKEHPKYTRVLTLTSSPMTRFQASQFSELRGKPSIRYVLLLAPSLKISRFTISTTISLGASLPSESSSLIFLASSQSVLMNSLSKSPVEQCLKPYLEVIISHCVPLPAPGPPRINTILGLLSMFIELVITSPKFLYPQLIQPYLQKCSLSISDQFQFKFRISLQHLLVMRYFVISYPSLLPCQLGWFQPALLSIIFDC